MLVVIRCRLITGVPEVHHFSRNGIPTVRIFFLLSVCRGTLAVYVQYP